MPTHASLTGADLHEPKGAASASANTLYIANGAGSGAWGKVTTTQIDTTSVFNVNKETFNTLFIDIGTAASQYVVMPFNCTVIAIYTVVNTSPTTTDTILTCYNQAGSSMGTITITAADPAGTVDSLTPSSNNTFTAGQRMQIATDGGCANNPNAHIAILVTRTA